MYCTVQRVFVGNFLNFWVTFGSWFTDRVESPGPVDPRTFLVGSENSIKKGADPDRIRPCIYLILLSILSFLKEIKFYCNKFSTEAELINILSVRNTALKLK